MNAPLPFDQTLSFAGGTLNAADVCAAPFAPAAVRDNSGNAELLDFVERRRIDAGAPDTLVRPPAVLGFVGVVWGLVVSAVLIIAVSAGLAMAGVSWMAAGQYCAAIILLVFGIVGSVLYWGTRTEHPFMTGIQQCLESAMERRRQHLYRSSLNALENARRLGVGERRIDAPAATGRGSFMTPRSA